MNYSIFKISQGNAVHVMCYKLIYAMRFGVYIDQAHQQASQKQHARPDRGEWGVVQ